MADLSAISPDAIRKFEEVLDFFGAEGVTVDGNPEDLDINVVADLVSKISVAAGGQPLTAADLQDDARIQQIQQSVEEFKDSRTFGMIKMLVSNGGSIDPDTLTSMAEGFGYDLNPVREVLGDDVFNNIGNLLDVLENLDGIFEVVNALRAGADPAEVAAEAARRAVEAAEAQAALEDSIKGVETALGISAPDGVWGDAEQEALKARVLEMQNNDPNWSGAKDGVYSDAYAAHVLSDASNSTDAQKALFTQLADIGGQGIELAKPVVVVEPLTPAKVEAATMTVEIALKSLIPVVQGELDAQRADAERLIESINGGKLSQKELDATKEHMSGLAIARGEALAVLKDENATSDAKAQAQIDYDRAEEGIKEAEIYLGRHTGLADNIGAFIDDFLLLGEYDLGRRMIETGKNWATDQIQGRLSRVHDLPSADRVTVDGRLDITEQTALQGVTYLLAQKLGIPTSTGWDYTPEFGQQILSRMGGLSIEEQEKFVLSQLDADDVAAYQQLSSDKKKEYLTEQIEEQTKALIAAMDTLEEAGVLTNGRLYFDQAVEIPDTTQDIFTDIIKGNPDRVPPIDAMSAEELQVLNLLVYEHTQGLDLVAVLGSDFEFPHALNDIDPTKTSAERFAEVYQRGMDLEEMSKMLDTLPFGAEKRRTEMKNLLALIKKKEEEDPDATVMILASMFGEGFDKINADPSAVPHYMYSEDRPVTMDPRLSDFSIQSGGQTIDENAIFALHKTEVNDFQLPVPYTPLYFKDDSGQTYVAAVDITSRVFQIEPLDLDGWKQVIENSKDPNHELHRQPDESARDHSIRVDAALREISGYELIFQNLFEADQVRYAGSFSEFPYSEFANNIPSYADVQARITGIAEERSMEALREDVEAARPMGVKDSLAKKFEGATTGSASSDRNPGTHTSLNTATDQPYGDPDFANSNGVPAKALPDRSTGMGASGQ